MRGKATRQRYRALTMNIPGDHDTRLDEGLTALARQPVPECPLNLSAIVWREIRRRRAEPADDWVTTLFEFFRRPTLAIPAFAFAIALGTLVGAMGATRSSTDIRLARQSLHLEVFEPNASGLSAVFASQR